MSQKTGRTVEPIIDATGLDHGAGEALASDMDTDQDSPPRPSAEPQGKLNIDDAANSTTNAATAQEDGIESLHQADQMMFNMVAVSRVEPLHSFRQLGQKASAHPWESIGLPVYVSLFQFNRD